MCQVKTGANVLNEEDVKNMITGIIFRLEDPFNEQVLQNLAEYYLKGSPLHLTTEHLGSMIRKSLDVFCRSGEVDCIGGYYRTRSIV